MSDSFKISRRTLLILSAAVVTGISSPVTDANAAPTDNTELLQPLDLRCEYLTNPLGIDETVPRLGWTYSSSSRSLAQSAYQIQAATSQQKLTTGSIDVWDSGKVLSDQNSQIEIAGTALTSGTEYFWQVRVWNNVLDASPWSETSTWEMGLLNDNDWQGAAWIGGTGASATTLPAPYLRRSFDCKSHIRRARIHSCGLGYADIYVNGQRVGGSIERDTAYTDFNKRILYSVYDVTDEIGSGKNTVGAILGSGWYDVNDLAVWNFDTASWKGPRRIRLALVVEYANGETQSVVTDGTWKTTTGGIQGDGIYSGEIYDARLEIPDWNAKEFDDSSWQPAAILPAPSGKIRARCCPPVRVTKTIPAVSITQPKPGVYIADFGQNLSGHVKLSLTAPAGTSITLRYGELIHDDGTLNRSNVETLMRKSDPPQLFQTDTYICKGGKEEIWEQRFSYSGFRFAEITGLPSAPATSSFSSRFAHTDLEPAGDFSCSDSMLNKLQVATRWSYLSNAQSIPTDCPQREKNGWTGDAHLAAETGLMNFRSATFYTKWLDDFSDNQVEDGQVGVIVPTQGWGRGDTHPAWDSAYPFITWDLYQFLGDRRIVERHYENIRRYVDYLTTRLEDGVIPFESLGDWVPWKTVTPSQFSSTIYYIRDAQIISASAKLLGKMDDYVKYAALAQSSVDAFNAKWLDPATGTYLPDPPVNASQTAQAMPLYYNIVPEKQRQSVFDSLVANVEAQGHIDTGILGAKAILIALTSMGRADLAYKLITRKEQPSWAWWIEQGGTTLWESWQGTDSHNHIMFGHISSWFIQSLAGIAPDPQSPGFRNIIFRPHPIEPLTWAKAYHDCPQGRIESEWHKKPDGFHWSIAIPANCTAEVWIPSTSSSTVYEGSQQVSEVPGVIFQRREGSSGVYIVEPGQYNFRST